jgi:hypothetical protein
MPPRLPAMYVVGEGHARWDDGGYRWHRYRRVDMVRACAGAPAPPFDLIAPLRKKDKKQ